MALGDITPLLAALKVAWNAGGSSLTSIAGPYKDRAPTPEEIDTPYAVISVVSFTHTFYTPEYDYWTLFYDLSIYDGTIELVGPRVAAVGAVLDIAANIVPSAGEISFVRRIGEGYTEEDKTLHRGTLSYQILWARPRAS